MKGTHATLVALSTVLWIALDAGTGGRVAPLPAATAGAAR